MRRTKILPLVIAAAALTATVGIVAGGVAEGEPRATDFDIPRERAAEVLATIRNGASPADRKVLDGGVSLDEYRGAARRSAACYRDGVTALAAQYGVQVPVEVGEPVVSPDQYSLTTSYRLDLRNVDPAKLPPNALDLTTRVEADCMARNLRPIERAYQIERKSDPAYTAKVARDAIACLRDAGMAGPGLAAGTLHASIRSHLVAKRGEPSDAVARCLEATPALTEDPLLVPGPPK